MLFSLLLASWAFANPDLQKYVDLHYQAEALVQEFDRELIDAEPGFLQQSRTYQRLLQIRQAKHAIIHQYAQSSPQILSYESKDLPAVIDFVENYNDHYPESEITLPPPSSVTSQPRTFAKSEELLSFINSFTADLPNDLLSPFTIEPGPGTNGNISGYNFPERTWALTYDDGPHATRTQAILEVLEQYPLKATFFWLAQNVAQLPDVVSLARTKGMSLQNHSYTHANLPKVNDASLEREIVDSTTLQASIYGTRPKFFRCPYGAGLNNLKIRQKIADQQMIHVFWNVDSLDWQDKNPQSIYQRVKTQMNKEKKGVILFHDIHAQTVETTKLLLQYTKALPDSQSIRWVTLPEIVDELNKK